MTTDKNVKGLKLANIPIVRKKQVLEKTVAMHSAVIDGSYVQPTVGSVDSLSSNGLSTLLKYIKTEY